ncbi:uncharacterized protein SAPINGB_P004897 [Magnusiomyces paraingens]|uniref:Uncharacterized protein n=1 Tax=Magnusiomyces paraingens TaxID=2606893 RepID=A0A5E8BXN1_9ASCO|nr:uncharacterized protein SAPINGB_P004897 [Saprochaete ingens]VVT56214.1 unnamed protein product [Saprochaete ingens]
MTRDLVPASKRRIENENKELVRQAVRDAQSQTRAENPVFRHTMTTPLIGTSHAGNLQLTIPATPVATTAVAKTSNNKYTVPERPKIVLEEDQYTAGLGKIITRDFFPDADEHGVAQAAAPNMSLDAYVRRYTSEDNASFNNLVEREAEAKRKTQAWFWKEGGSSTDDASKRLQITAYEESPKALIEKENAAVAKVLGWSDERKTEVDTWSTSKGPTNALMFHPNESSAGPRPTTEQKQSHAAKRIIYENTRFPKTPRNANKKKEEEDTGDDISAADARPRVNGYSFVTENTYSSDRQFEMQPPSEKDAARDRLLARKIALRRQERSAAAAALTVPKDSTVSSLGTSIRTPGSLSSARISKRAPTPLSPAASSILQSIRSHKTEIPSFSKLRTPIRRKPTGSPVVRKK